MLTEVQISCTVLMTLMSFILMFTLPRYIIMDKVYNYARKLLICGSILVAAHFTIQIYYTLRC